MKEFLIYITAASLCHIISTQRDVRVPPAVTSSYYTEYSDHDDGVKEARLICEAKGTPAVRYEWKMNGFQLNTNVSNIRKSSNGSLTIMVNRETQTAEGYYQCFATNQYGTAISDMIHVRTKFIEPSIIVLQKTVVEGMPFHIQCPDSGYYAWYIATEGNARYKLTRVEHSERIQISKNGDLHFAYALLEDAPSGNIYICSSDSESLARTQLRRTQLKVRRNPSGNISCSAPTTAFVFFYHSPGVFLSEKEAVVLVGGEILMKCFFYGYPEPMISWKVQTNTHSSGRHGLFDFSTTLLYLDPVAESDEGNYSCTGSNTEGNSTYTFQIRVEDSPKFYNRRYGYNQYRNDINVTERESATFHCDPFAIPEVNIVWLQNGQPIDTHNPPQRFVFSNDNRSLTIINVCRDCVDQERQTDLMVIQCNASNVYGYAFTQGYLNVLMKTNVTIRSSRNVSADFLKFVYHCYVTSDPSTPLTVLWYKIEPFDDIHVVINRPPYVHVENRFLTIMVFPSCASECTEYHGKYRCDADNGYSRDNQTITHSYEHWPQTEDITRNKEVWAVWQIIFVVAAIGLILFLIGVLLYFRCKTRFRDASSEKIERRKPNPTGIYDDAGYDLVGLPLEDIVGSNARSTARQSGEYDHIGYDSIDQVLEAIGNTGYDSMMPRSLDAHGKNKYESLDAPHGEAKGRESPMLDKGITCDDDGYLMPLEEDKNGVGRDQQQINNCKSVQGESEEFSKSNEQSASTNTYSDLNRKEDNGNLHLIPTEVKPHSNLTSKAVNPYLDLVPNEVNQYLDLEPNEVNQYMNLDLKKKDSHLDLDLSLKEVNQSSDLESKEKTPS